MSRGLPGGPASTVASGAGRCESGALMHSFGIFLQGLLGVVAFSTLMRESRTPAPPRPRVASRGPGPTPWDLPPGRVPAWAPGPWAAVPPSPARPCWAFADWKGVPDPQSPWLIAAAFAQERLCPSSP